jgi:glycosyltransferase involved in cell wall biosynthesis
MKVVIVSFYYPERLTNEEELLQLHYTITGWAEALQRAGIETVVISRFTKESSFRKNNVQYYFVKDNLGPTPKAWQIATKFLRKIKDLTPDIVHLHNLTLSLQTFWLRQILKKKTAIVVQHHGGVAPGKTKRFIHNLFNGVADGFFFTSVEQGLEWFMKRERFDKIFPVMEGATFFNYKTRDADRSVIYTDRIGARRATGMNGTPMFLWVGRLDRNKDPLTVLAGFEILFEKYPAAELYMIYTDENLLPDIKTKLVGSNILSKRVHLLGRIAHLEMQCYYNSADYFVLGSHYEGSGYALSEALKCGCIPIVTSIPSFRVMTSDGQLGALWEPGNRDSFVAAAIEAINKPQIPEAINCIDFFRQFLSFDAIAGIAAQHYQKLIDTRTKGNK